MTTPSLLVALRARGIHLTLRETKDGLSASVSSNATADDLAQLKEHMAEVGAELLAEAREEVDRWYDVDAALRRAPLFYDPPKDAVSAISGGSG